MFIPVKRAVQHQGRSIIKDQKPGDTTGDGVNKVWHVVKQ